MCSPWLILCSRAQAPNAIFELLALQKPMLLVPLPLSQSRGDQLRNAASFQQKGLCRVLQEEALAPDVLEQELERLYIGREEYKERMRGAAPPDPLPQIASA